MNHRIGSIDELISALGGPTALGEHLGVGASAVSNWIARGYIPTGWHLRLYLEVERRGLSIDLSVFGFVANEFPPLRDKPPMGMTKDW